MILSEKILVSAIVCTHNGRDRILQTLISLSNQSLSKKFYEIIVVDNCSTDDTCDWLQDMQQKLSFKLICEDQKGLSSARNAGIKVSRGDLIFFTDDDAVLPAHHLETILNDHVNESADAVGGAVHGLWADTPPTWLMSKHWRRLSLVSYGNSARQLVYPEILIGCNIGFHKSVFQKYGYFNSSLGRTGDLLLGNEERLLEWKMMRDGCKVWYNPNAYVFHMVSEERFQIEYHKNRTRSGVYSNLILKEFTKEEDTITKYVETLYAPQRSFTNRFSAKLQIWWLYFKSHGNFLRHNIKYTKRSLGVDSQMFRNALKGRSDYFKEKYNKK